MVTDSNRLWSVGEKVQLQREGLMPRSMSLEISLDGITVLKAELKSMNSILTYVLLLSKERLKMFVKTSAS